MHALKFYVPVLSFLIGAALGSRYSTLFTWPWIGALVLVGIGTAVAATSHGTPFFKGRVVTLLILAAVTLGTGLGGFMRGQASAPVIPEALLAALNRPIKARGVVTAIPDERDGRTQLTVELQVEGETARVLARVPPYPRTSPGDLLTLTGRLEKPRPFEGDAGRTFAYDRFLAKNGIVLILQYGEFEIVGQSSDPWLRFLRLLGTIRSGAVQALERSLPEPESGLAVGILLGGKQGLGNELLNDFIAAGLVPIVVLSGYNVAIVAAAVRRALYRMPAAVATTASILAVGCFVLAAGAGASAVRAALMACTAIVADATGRRYLAYRSLALSLCLIAFFSPAALLDDPGLQLSFLSTLGLIAGTPIVERRLSWIRWLPARTLVASTLAAQIGVLPHLLWLTGNLSLVAIPANLLALPLVPFAMAASAATIPIALLPLPLIVGAVSGLPAYVMLGAIVAIARGAASLPFALVMLPDFPLPFVGVTYACLVVVVILVSRHDATDSAPGHWPGALYPCN